MESSFSFFMSLSEKLTRVFIGRSKRMNFTSMSTALFSIPSIVETSVTQSAIFSTAVSRDSAKIKSLKKPSVSVFSQEI